MDKPLIIIMAFLTIYAVATLIVPNPYQAQATGCPVDTIIPMLDEAIKSLEAGDTQTGLSQLKDATNEIKDTFEVE